MLAVVTARHNSLRLSVLYLINALRAFLLFCHWIMLSSQWARSAWKETYPLEQPSTMSGVGVEIPSLPWSIGWDNGSIFTLVPGVVAAELRFDHAVHYLPQVHSLY